MLTMYDYFSASKKSVALKCVTAALNKVEQMLRLDTEGTAEQIQSQNSEISTSEMRPSDSFLYSVNETITTAKLSDRLAESDGSYLGLQDEIEGLFESLEGKSREVLDRRLWLSLYTGIGVTRSTSKKTSSIPATRLNYSGEFVIQLSLNIHLFDYLGIVACFSTFGNECICDLWIMFKWICDKCYLNLAWY